MSVDTRAVGWAHARVRSPVWLLLCAGLAAPSIPGAAARAQTWTSDAPTRRPAPAERSFWNLRSDASFTAYAVASSLSPVVWERRRFVEVLGLSHVFLPGEVPSESRFRIETAAVLRLDQDFGRDCVRATDRCYDATEETDRLAFQPLARRTRLDVPTFHVTLHGPRALMLRAGRQIGLDAAGMYRFDGARVAVAPFRWLRAESYAGRRVRPGSFAGSPGLGLQGSIHVVLPGSLAPVDSPVVAPAPRTMMAGGTLEVGLERFVRARAFARQTWDPAGLVLSYVGTGLTSRPHRSLELRGDLVWELGAGELVEAWGEVALHALQGTARVRLRRHVPRFDHGSIWGFFDPVPVSQAELIVDAPPLGDVRLGGALRARRSVPSEGLADNRGVERDAGGELWGRIARGAWWAELRGFLWAGSLSPVAAVLGELRRVLGARGAAWLRVSAWRFDDPWRPSRDTTSVALALGGEYRLTRQSRFALDVEWAHSGLVHHRIRALGWFTVRMWR